jgi:hypothetical protein
VEALRGTIAEAVLTAALDAQDRVVYEARLALDSAQAGVVEVQAPPDATEIAVAPPGALGEFLELYGLVVEVDPAFGDRRAGRVAERVRLRPHG